MEYAHQAGRLLNLQNGAGVDLLPVLHLCTWRYAAWLVVSAIFVMYFAKISH
jgi:hypothetical protein